MTSVGYDFLCGRPHRAKHMRPPEPDCPPSPCGRHKRMVP